MTEQADGRKISILWNYFEKDPISLTGKCKFCQKILSYRSTICNLNAHLKQVHKFMAYKEYTQSTDSSESDYQTDKKQDETNIEEEAVTAETTRKQSKIWDYFDKDNDYRRALCHICLNTLSYKSTTYNLKMHLKSKHIEAYNECMSKCGYKQADKNETRSNSETNYIDQNNEESVHEWAENLNTDSETEHLEFTDEEYLEEVEVPGGRTGNQSVIWTYFAKDNNSRTAVCNFCQNTLSYKSTIHNLKQHLRRKHIEAYKECMSQYDYNQQSKHQTNAKSETNYVEQNNEESVHERTENLNTDSETEHLEFTDEEYLEEAGVPGGSTGSRSIIWAYFAKDNDSRTAVCHFCQNTLSYKSTTNNLKQHLRRKHIEAYKECMSRYAYNQQSKHQTKSESGRATSSVSIDGESIYEQVINILKPKTEDQELSNDDEQIVELVVGSAETEESDPLSSQCQPDVIQTSGLKSFRVRLKDLKEINKSSKIYKSNNKDTMKKKIYKEETTQKDKIIHELDIQIKKEELRIKRELFKQNLLKTRLMLLELRSKKKKIRRCNTQKHKKIKKPRV